MRTYAQAVAFARRQHNAPSQDWFNLCQALARQCVGAAPFGLSAREAFNAIPREHRHVSDPPPAGSIAYYGRVRAGFGHAVFVVEDGFVWSNDILRKGKVDKVRWDVFVDRWGLAYRGWIDRCPHGELPVTRPDESRAHGGGASKRRRAPEKPRQEVQPDAVPGLRRGGQVFSSRMRFGQADSDSVWNLQVALIGQGLSIPAGPSDFYGAQTLAACTSFQRSQGWAGAAANGVAGPVTVTRLGLTWVKG
jgi:hypothetical protein